MLTDGEKEALEGMDDHALIEMWDTYKDQEDRNKSGRQLVEYLLLRRMIDRVADAVPSSTHDIRLTHPYDTDVGKLDALRELIDPAMIAEGYTPPQQVWTDPKWNMTVLNSWRKYGSEIAGVIDGAKLPKPAHITIKRKAAKAVPR